MCALETRTNFFPFKKSPKPGCLLNSGAYYIREYTVLVFLKTVVDLMYLAAVGCHRGEEFIASSVSVCG